MRKVPVAACLLFLLLSAPIYSAGFWIYETGGFETATADAGRSSRADDAFTAYGNPAGMARLGSPNLLVGIPIQFFTTEFNLSQPPTFGGDDGGNAGTTLPSIGIYLVRPLSPAWRLGFTLNSHLGGRLNYGNTWAGRYYVIRNSLVTFDLNPSVAYRINPYLSLGAGFSTAFATIDRKSAINNILDTLADGRLTAQGKDIGIGGNFGILFEPLPFLRFGVTYRLPEKFVFEDPIEITDLGPSISRALAVAGVLGASEDLTVRMPQELLGGFYVDIGEKIAAMADVGWQQWSRLGEISGAIASPEIRSFAVTPNLKNTVHAAGGIHYKLITPLRLMAGFAYDSSPVDDEDRSVSLPLDRQLRYAGGLSFAISKALTVGVAYEYIDLGEAPINQTRGPLVGTVSGDYSPSRIHIANVNMLLNL